MPELTFEVAGKLYTYDEYKSFLQQLHPNNPEIVDHLISQIDKFRQKRGEHIVKNN